MGEIKKKKKKRQRLRIFETTSLRKITISGKKNKNKKLHQSYLLSGVVLANLLLFHILNNRFVIMTIHLRRSSPSIHQLAQIQRLHSRQLSAPPESPSASLPLLSKASNANTDHLKDCIFDSLARWFSGIVVGSSLGLLYWSSNSDSISTKSSLFPVSFLSFADWSMSTLTNDTTDDDDDDRQSSSSSLFRKLSLPDYSSNFLFGGKIFNLISEF